MAQGMAMVVTEDISVFGALLGGRAQVGGVAVAEAEGSTVVAARVGNATRSANQAKSAAEMAEELASQTGKNSVSYQTPTKSGHIDFKDVRQPHFDKASGGRIAAPTVQEATLNRGPNGRINTSKPTTRSATKQDIRTARKLIEHQ